VKSELHAKRMVSRERTLVAPESTTCRLFQPQMRHLQTVGGGIETKAVGNRQARSPEGGKVGRLGAEATGIGRLGR
jgi:hypothetical protein